MITNYNNWKKIYESSNIKDDYIIIDNKKVSTKNSNNEYISNTLEGIINFYKWFDKSKTIDNKLRPIVYYHISNATFDTFNQSKNGKMGPGIYFTSIYDDLYMHSKYDKSTTQIYQCYLKIENPLEIENPYSPRHDNNDGIFAYKNKSGEEIKVYKPNQIKNIKNDGSFDIFNNNMYS